MKLMKRVSKQFWSMGSIRHVLFAGINNNISLYSFLLFLIECLLLLIVVRPTFPVHADAATGTDVVIVIDNSGSMGPEPRFGNHDPSKLRYSGARLFVDLAERGDRVGLVRFATEAEIVNPNDQLSLIEDDSSRNLIKSYISDTDGMGETNFSDALEKAQAMLKDSSRNRFVVFLTDGDPTVEEDKLPSALEWFEFNEIPVFVIVLGSDVNQQVVNDIVSRTHSRSVRAHDAGQLIQAYIEIFSFLQDDRYVNEMDGIRAGDEVLFSAEVESSQFVSDVWFIFAATESGGEVLSSTSSMPRDVREALLTDNKHYQIVRYESTSPMIGEWAFRGRYYDDIKAYALFNSSIRLQLEYPVGLGNLDSTTRYFGSTEEVLIGAQIVRDGMAVPAAAGEEVEKTQIEAVVSQEGDSDWSRISLSSIGLSDNNSLYWTTFLPPNSDGFQIQLQAQQQQQPLQLAKVYEVRSGAKIPFAFGAPIVGNALTDENKIPISVHQVEQSNKSYEIHSATAYIRSPRNSVEVVELVKSGNSWIGASSNELSIPGEYAIRVVLVGVSGNAAFTSFVEETMHYENSLVLLTDNLDFGSFRTFTDTLTHTIALKPLFISEVPPVTFKLEQITDVSRRSQVGSDRFILESTPSFTNGKLNYDINVKLTEPMPAGIYEGQIAILTGELDVKPNSKIPFRLEIPEPKIFLSIPAEVDLEEVWRIGSLTNLGQLEFSATPHLMVEPVNIDEIEVISLVDEQAQPVAVTQVDVRLASNSFDSESGTYQYSLIVDPHDLPSTGIYTAQIAFHDASEAEIEPSTIFLQFRNLSALPIEFDIPQEIDLGEIWQIGPWVKGGQYDFSVDSTLIPDPIDVSEVKINSLNDENAQSIPVSQLDARLAIKSRDLESGTYHYSLFVLPTDLSDTGKYSAQVTFREARGVDLQSEEVTVRFRNLSVLEVSRRIAVNFVTSPKTLFAFMIIFVAAGTYRRFIYAGFRGKLRWKGAVRGKSIQGHLNLKGNGPYYIMLMKSKGVRVVHEDPPSEEAVILARITPVPRAKKIKVRPDGRFNKFFRILGGAKNVGFPSMGKEVASRRQFQLCIRNGTQTVAQVTFTYRAPLI